MNTAVFLTGAAGGLGQLVAARLLADGHHVAATMRNAAGRNQEAAGRLRYGRVADGEAGPSVQRGGGAARTAEYRIPTARTHLLRPPGP